MASKSSNRLIVILLIIAALLIVGVIVAKKMGFINTTKPTKVSTEATSRRTIIELVSGSGKIQPEVEVKISPDVSGEIVELLVEEGDSVKKGQRLARIKPDMYNSLVEQAEAAVNSAKANAANAQARIKQLEVQRDQQQRDLERNRQLNREGLLSQVELQNSETLYQSTLMEIDAAKESTKAANFNINSAQANLKEANNNLGKTTLYAPMSGIISRLNVKEGERVVGTSQFEGTEMLRIADYANMEVRVDVSENDIIKVSEGDTAMVEVDAYLDKKFVGIVTQISNTNNSTASLAASTDQLTNYTVKIRLLKSSYADLLQNGKSFPFRPEMSASADIQTLTLRNIITVPIESVTLKVAEDSLQSAQNMAKQEIVFVESNGIVLEQNVVSGIQDDNYIEIKKGLEEGKMVVTAPYRAITKFLKDSTAVEVVSKEELFKEELKE
ncbi:MAG: efflux RND transporter periplasmic adaptor subunit [Chitinophagales bacterium]|nr:efflux RND transporter periplasmic adaptor subunit [Bacteroidota bacterium]MCB9042492.1 efflux RND transporter periplasmic adaptor subunit [Chitinophagales bacterium]